MQNESGTRGRILIVDDEEPIGKLLQNWLGDEGYETRYARDGSEVAGFFEQERFDLVSLDIMMPGMDGLEVLKWIRESYPEVGVIMATDLIGSPLTMMGTRAAASARPNVFDLLPTSCAVVTDPFPSMISRSMPSAS